MFGKSKHVLSIGLVLLSAALPAVADVKLPSVIGDHMVLQRGVPVPIWGTADAGEEVTVAIGDQRAKTKADAGGRWLVRLEPLKTGSTLDMTVTGKNTIKVADILVGEVWLASGQSNMQFVVKSGQNAEAEAAAATDPAIRMFTAKTAVAGKPMNDVPGKWVVCSPQTVGDFSAVGYFFGRDLRKTLNVPVGIVHSSWGGTPAESWTSRPTLEADADLRVIADRSDAQIAEYRKPLEAYKKNLIAWIDEAIATTADPLSNAPKAAPPLPADPRSQSWRASGLYNAMIAPLVPYAIKGVIWYQGESNANRAYQYRKLFPAMIQDWRQAWGQGDFPFLFVQLANYKTNAPKDGTWAELREAQTMTLELKNTGMAVAIDIGNPTDIHPKNKQEVGRRLALAAQSIAYGKKLVYSGPMYESMSIEGDKIRIKFAWADGLKTPDGQGLDGFTIAGEDKNFVEAKAEIDGDTVVVSSDAVAKPVAVRYGWSDCPVCTLLNGAGLPASPFRTDDWPGLTINDK